MIVRMKSQCLNETVHSPSLSAMFKVAKLVDSYLAEIAPDTNLDLPKFLLIAEALPLHARTLHDGLYRAVDLYLKTKSQKTKQQQQQSRRINSGTLSEAMSPKDNYASLRRENRELKLELARLRMRVNDLEKEHICMKRDMQRTLIRTNS